jgi:ribosomal protein S18 acetylase RimI-like enzyme
VSEPRRTVGVEVRCTRAEDFPRIIELGREVYPGSPLWTEAQLSSHLKIFPEGQFVAVRRDTGAVVGMAASLIVSWNDYDMSTGWRDFTDHGMFTNHDPGRGRTLYGAEVMVDPKLQGSGVGTKIYQARRALAVGRKLLRIRAGARLRGYHRYATQMSAEQYAIQVARRELWDPTVSFQLRRGFAILAVVPDYLHHDPESLGYAAVIEWLNRDVATPEDSVGRDPRFLPPPKTR